MRLSRSSRRRGIALVLALGLMMLVGLLVAGAVTVSRFAQRSSQLVATDAALTAAADYSLGTVIGDPVTFGLADLPLGRQVAFDVLVPENRSVLPVSAIVAATRLPGGVLWLVAATAMGDAAGARRVNLVARFRSPGRLPPAAIVARGTVRARVNVSFAVDTARDADCSTAAPPAVIVGPGATADVAPGTLSDISRAAADSATYYLTSRQLALLDSGMRVIHVRGDTVIGGSFDGILLVDGRLTLTGPTTVNGLVVARGPIVVAGAGASDVSVVGAMMSFAAAPSVAVDIAGATIRYAPCTVARVIRAASPPKPVTRRSWSELF